MRMMHLSPFMVLYAIYLDQPDTAVFSLDFSAALVNVSLLAMTILHFCAFRPSLQAYLDLALARQKRIAHATGKTTPESYAKSIRFIFALVGVVATELISIPVLSGALMLLYTHTSGITFIPLTHGSADATMMVFFHSVVKYFTWWYCVNMGLVTFVTAWFGRALGPDAIPIIE
jgi:hypothetical protein